MTLAGSWKDASATFAQIHRVIAPMMAKFMPTHAATMTGHHQNIRQDSAMDEMELASTMPMILGR